MMSVVGWVLVARRPGLRLPLLGVLVAFIMTGCGTSSMTGSGEGSRGPVPTHSIVGQTTDRVGPHPAVRGRHARHESFQAHATAIVVACLRRAGVSVPRSGSAVLSSTAGIRTHDPRVKAAIARCRAAPEAISR